MARYVLVIAAMFRASDASSRAREIPDAHGRRREIFALAFDSPAVAREAMTLAMHLQELDQVVLHDAVFVRLDGDEPALPTEDGDPAPVAAAVPSALLGALIGTFVAGPMGFLIGGVVGGGGGATIAKLLGSGIRDAVVRELRARLRPGQTALGLQVSHVVDEHALDELRRLPGAQVLPTTTTPPSAIARPARGTC